MKGNTLKWYYGAALMLVLMTVPIMIFWPSDKGSEKDPNDFVKETRAHLDHAAYFTEKFDRPQDVTLACLECHEDAAKEVMATPHFTWERGPVKLPGRDETMMIGKKNLINNFCIGITGNAGSCSGCHAGYGWDYDGPMEMKEENVDCLICHDWSGTYVKGDQGMPVKGVDLKTVAQSVGYPKRDNCGICHIYGGGGMGVKHGDLDNTLVNATKDLDVHMGQHNMLCIDCHKTEEHKITGQAYSLSVKVDEEKAIFCTKCHEEQPHKDKRINEHISAVACQTCHIPSYARKAPTKMHWDYTKAGDPTREDDHLTYLKIKGEFIYDQNVLPEYEWFNRSVDRYIVGDKIDPSVETGINDPRGDISDPTAKIWPFKIHRTIQPYDAGHNYLTVPTTSGPGGFWREFNWEQSFQLSEKNTGMDYSGKYGFTKTRMHWPLSHMVTPADKALMCDDCHGPTATRLDWKALGYPGDPAETGGRKTRNLLKENEKEQ